MGLNTLIEWTHFPGFQGATWNPWQGCHKVSQGCKNCYMFRDKKRYGQDPDTVVRSKSNTFNLPLRIQIPTVFFVCSWSDFYIEEADGWREEARDIIWRTPHHRYLILTKRPERIPGHYIKLQNIALGVTAETQEMADLRLPILVSIPVPLYFVSVEPILEHINLNFYLGANLLDWVITGGESGPNFRPLDPIWIKRIANDCKNAGIPLFHKQNGGTVKVNGVWGGNEVLGDKYQEFPEWEL